MSDPVARFAAFLKLSDDFLARSERGDLEECSRILAVQFTHYKSKSGELALSETLEVFASETMNDEQAKQLRFWEY